MKRNMIAAVILILSAGVVASYLIVKKYGPKPNLIKSGPTEGNEEVLISKNPIKWLGRTVAKLGDLASGELGATGESEKISLPQDIDFENFNLTEFVAKSSFSQMKNLDQGGKNPFQINPNDPASKEFIEKVIAGIQNPETLLNQKINNEDLKISNDNSKENKIKYINNFEQILIKNTNNDIYRNPDKAVNDAMEKGNVSDVKKLADIYKNIFNEFINITTPSDYLKAHKEYLEISKKMEVIYGGIANFQSDPVKALLLLKLWQETIKAEMNFFRVSKFN